MEKIYFRPNAPISSLFNDLPNEIIIIDEDTISETITDYQGNVLAEKDGTSLSIHVWETLIAAFDDVSEPFGNLLQGNTWESLCQWLKTVLESRGWIPVTSGQWDGVDGKEIKCVNGQELFFEMEID